MIHPYLMYCNIIWGGASKANLSPLFRLQKRSIRLITFSKYRATTDPLFQATRVLKLNDIRNSQLLIFVYRHQHGLLPSSCKHHLNQQNSYSIHALRNTYCIPSMRFRTKLREAYVGVCRPHLWNSPPLDVLISPGLQVFKKNLFNHFLKQYI